MKEKEYCSSCHQKVPYTVYTADMDIGFEGKTYNVPVKIAKCNVCDSVIELESIDEENYVKLMEKVAECGDFKPITEDINPNDLHVYIPENAKGEEGFVLKVLIGLLLTIGIIAGIMTYLIAF